MLSDHMRKGFHVDLGKKRLAKLEWQFLRFRRGEQNRASFSGGCECG